MMKPVAFLDAKQSGEDKGAAARPLDRRVWHDTETFAFRKGSIDKWVWG